jgi:glycosyltransferase involved in cell wall biosynthesis
VYVPNYVDSAGFEPDFDPGDYFVFFGRLSKEKGIHTLLAAAEAGKFKLVLVGVGELEPDALAAAGRCDSIRVLGRKSGAELWQIVKGARATILPSEWYENAPLSVLEGYALGKPVIGARIGGIPEMVREGETGWLFESGSTNGLVEAMNRVKDMSDSELEEVGRHARQFVATNFSPRHYLQDILSLYQSVGVQIAVPGDASMPVYS